MEKENNIIKARERRRQLIKVLDAKIQQTGKSYLTISKLQQILAPSTFLTLKASEAAFVNEVKLKRLIEDLDRIIFENN